MPLPVEQLPSSTPSSIPSETNPNNAFNLVQRLESPGINPRNARFNTQNVRYLDLNHCFPSKCSINRLNSPLRPLLRYEFFFRDGSPVIGQQPVFNLPNAGENDSPFRRIVQVIVPDDYQANTIRSAEDVLASRFELVPSARVLNNPLLQSAVPMTLELNQGRAWLQNQEQNYLELGITPYAPERNQLGVGVAYFLRNRDKSDLPSQPVPIFDTTPGDLLYSPIRQVFRAISENQIETLNADPAREIRSQEELLEAVNSGLFRLEDTGEFFNYPVYLSNTENSPALQLRIQQADHLPTLPPSHYYALWVANASNQARLLLRFRAEGGQLNQLEGPSIVSGSRSDVIFRFSKTETLDFRYFLVTLETGDITQPTGPRILEANYASGQELLLQTPFAPSYSSLQSGTFLLAAPSAGDERPQNSGIWFVERRDGEIRSLPFNGDLDPGLVLALPPRGWTYNGWILTQLNPPRWLSTGAFRAINTRDSRNPYSNREGTYTFPGEDFVRNAPDNTVFPLNLSSTGEYQVVVSLEPEGLPISQPFFRLYEKTIERATPELSNQVLPVSAPRFPSLRLSLSEN